MVDVHGANVDGANVEGVAVGRVAVGGAVARSPLREVFSDPNFRRFFGAQVLFSAVMGTLRFTFVWLIVTLTDWSAAEGLIAIAFGLPAMLLSVPAGAWSDRADRRTLFVAWTAAAAVAMAAFTAAIAAGVVTPVIAGVAAVVIGTLVTVNMPNISAMVPLLVEPRLLMNAVALQNGASQAASFLGLAVAGVAIAVLGDGGGFGLLAGLSALSVLLMWRVALPAGGASTRDGGPSMLASIVEGARFGYGTEPLRSLLVVSILLGGSFSVMQVSMPRVVDEIYGGSSSEAGLVLAIFGAGMLVGSMVVSGRSVLPHGRIVLVNIGIGLGLGQFLVSLAPSVPWAMLVMFGWGINAGLAMVSHRTLLQTNTPPEMMGRVMGLMTLGFAGSLPIGALVQSLLAPALGAQRTMTVVGLGTIALAFPLLVRPAIRRL
jgi:MFS family permease